MRLLRLILEGLLVTAVAALVFYPLRHHPVAGLVLVILICLVGIAVITLVERRLAQRRSNKEKIAQPASKPSPVDLTITNDMGQIHVRNNGPRAEFTAEIAGVIATNGTELVNKRASVSWMGPSSQDDVWSMDIPTGATRTLALWEPRIAFPGIPALTTFNPFLLAYSDAHIPIGADHAIGVRLRVVRVDPPGITERMVTIGKHGDQLYCEV